MLQRFVFQWQKYTCVSRCRAAHTTCFLFLLLECEHPHQSIDNYVSDLWEKFRKIRNGHSRCRFMVPGSRWNDKLARCQRIRLRTWPREKRQHVRTEKPPLFHDIDTFIHTNLLWIHLGKLIDHVLLHCQEPCELSELVDHVHFSCKCFSGLDMFGSSFLRQTRKSVCHGSSALLRSVPNRFYRWRAAVSINDCNDLLQHVRV